jgi:hypothetical protein
MVSDAPGHLAYDRSVTSPYGGAPGWGSYPPPNERPYERPRDTGATLGWASFALAVASIPLAFFGVVLLLALIGFPILILAVLAAAAAVLLAVASIVTILLTPLPDRLRRARMMPAFGTLLLLGAALGYVVVDTHKPKRVAVARRPESAAASPYRVASTANIKARTHQYGELCLLLAPRVRGNECATGERFCPAKPCDVPLVVLSSKETVRGSRATVTYRIGGSRDFTEHRVRLERTGEGWGLLDVPGVPDRCADTAKDPFTCPVRAY